MKSISPIRFCVLDGDGISPEITAATLHVLRAAAAKWQIEFAFDEVEVGLKPLAAHGTTFRRVHLRPKAGDGVIAGQDKANPSSLIGSAAMLLAWLGERREDARLLQAAEGIERALDAVIAVPEWRTGDLGGPLGTKAFGERVGEALR
jgi:isocitrate/isopropylmalate dehydrogenase